MPLVKFGVENQNLELFYEVHGTGKTKVLFIMGLLTEGLAWIYQVSAIFISFHWYKSIFRVPSSPNNPNIK